MKIIRRLINIFLTCLILSGYSFAQDIHFSQFYFSPLYLNPSQTGFIGGDYRIAGNFRDQWGNWTGIRNPYVTYSASYDMKLLTSGIINKDYLGAGIFVSNDRTSSGTLNTMNVMLSTAYHKFLNKDESSELSLGIQAGIIQKSIDYNGLKWDKQILDPLSGSGESFENTVFMYPDFSAGVLYSVRPSKNLDLYTGLASFHLTKPEESFFASTNNKVNRRHILHSGAAYKTGGNYDILPSILFMTQGPAKQINIGSAIRFNSLISGSGVRFGVWYRNSGNTDAFILMTGLEYNKNITIGLSYDANVSALSAISKGRGAYEIALIYVSKSSPKNNYIKSVVCPRF